MDIKSQRIVIQLENLYSLYTDEDVTLLRSYSHFLFHHIFDFLEAQNIKIDYPPEVKRSLWKLAKTELNDQRKAWITGLNQQTDPKLIEFFTNQLKIELDKFYKTYLVRKYLFDMLRNEGKKLEIISQKDGSKIKRFELFI